MDEEIFNDAFSASSSRQGEEFPSEEDFDN
jgi:hypothetical protein